MEKVTSVHWASHFLQGTRKTRPCLTGEPVLVDPVAPAPPSDTTQPKLNRKKNMLNRYRNQSGTDAEAPDDRTKVMEDKLAGVYILLKI